ncbi:MAG: hypothetical protein K0Q72_5480 [Armatimonadetes bacterium]|nr:hypothetical protein [Armatimonadota bacterium]
MVARTEEVAALMQEIGGGLSGAATSIRGTASTLKAHVDAVDLSFGRMAVSGALRAWEASPEGQKALASLAASLDRHAADLDGLEAQLREI